MILPNSRYANSTIAAVETSSTFGDTDVSVIVPSAALAYNFQYVSHQVALGERIDSIAFQYYTDATLWYYIAYANPEIMWWDNLTPGLVIRVPLI